MAYGVNTKDSDWDIVAFCIPPKETIFPHLAGVVPGFGTQIGRFKTIHRPGDTAPPIIYNGREYDITIYGIVDFFQLCMGMNPNMISYLFVPDNCVLHSTSIGNLARDNRKLFLSKKCWVTFKSYAYSQLKKLRNKKSEGKRLADVEKNGFDTKYAYNLVRLLGECEQLLATGDLNLQRDRKQLKAIRQGEWTLEQLQDFFNIKELELEGLHRTSELPYEPDEAKIKDLLIQCLKIQYGDLSAAVTIPGRTEAALREIQAICERENL